MLASVTSQARWNTCLEILLGSKKNDREWGTHYRVFNIFISPPRLLAHVPFSKNPIWCVANSLDHSCLTSKAEECYYIRNVTRPTAQSTDESGMEYSLAAEPCSGEISYMTISVS